MEWPTGVCNYIHCGDWGLWPWTVLADLAFNFKKFNISSTV